MIFKPELAAKVLDGTKTMTRRRLPCRYQAGRWYKVQPGRGKLHVCHIRIAEVREEPLIDILEDDAQREGFKSVAAFFLYWRRIHGEIDLSEHVAVIKWLSLEIKPCCAKLVLP